MGVSKDFVFGLIFGLVQLFSDFSFVGSIAEPLPGLDPKPDLISIPIPTPGLDSNLCPTPDPDSECKPHTEYFPQYIVIPQYNPTSGPMFSNVSSVILFINTFLDKVYKTDTLREAFDISDSTPKQYGDFVRKYTEGVLLKIGVDIVTAATIGEFAARAIAPNFDVLTLGIVSRAYGNMAANFLFVDGDLELCNAEDLASKLAQSITDFAKVTINEDPTSKFVALANGFVNFFVLQGLFTVTKAPILGYYVGNEWFLAAVNYRCL